MGLKPCHGCGQKCDTSAKACPNCGRPKPTTSTLAKTIGALAGAAVIIVAVKMCVGGALDPSTSSEPSYNRAAPSPPTAPAPTAPAPSAQTPADGEFFPASAPAYDGPLGLRWGQSPVEVRKALAGRLTLKRENKADDGKTIVQHYSGRFAGYLCEIEMNFRPGLLIFVAELPAEDMRPASRRWADLVEATTREHGPPAQIDPPPKVPSLAALADNYPAMPNADKIRALAKLADSAGNAMLDAKIQAGEWKPLAVWLFSNGGIGVGVKAGDPDRYGHRPLRPTWGAFPADMFKGDIFPEEKHKSDL